ncbi:MAG: DUF4876 domain-containing protein [Bacteroidales bacterium]
MVACESDDEVELANLDVQVDIADTFTGLSAADLYVYITNTADNGVDSALTDANGLAVFNNVAPGSYNVSATKELTAEEAGAASGYYEEMTLNAVENDVQLMAGFDSDVTVTLDGESSSSLVIKEFYYNGANDPTYSILFKDQFVEIYNNSDEVVYADGLYLASLSPSTSGSDASDVPLGLDLTEYVYASKILRIPGNGTDNPVQPGESIVICLNAVDYTDGGANEDISVDLSTADFETYAVSWLESLGRTGNSYFDLDNVDVPNMECVYLNIENNGWFNFDIESSSIAIFRNDNFAIEQIADPRVETPSSSDYFAKINVEDIVDGIDMMYNAETSEFKRLPSSIDAGFKYIDGDTYTSKSVRRKVANEVDGRKILKDTNNSTNDFEVTDLPTPGGFGN